MKQLPRSIYNPLIGDTVTFLETASETGGKYCLVQVMLPAGGGNGLHYHTAFSEYFTGISGTLSVDVGKEKLALKKGQSYLVRENVIHRFYNETADTVEFQCVISPARQFEQLLRVVYGLTNDKKVNHKTGIPKNLFVTGIVFQMGESYLPGMPLWLQKGLFGTIATVGTWLGYKKRLEKYYVGNLEPMAKPTALPTAAFSFS
jgi:mannose-6-phosphate isomerase-like protein (cupin superfamily)